VAVGVEDPSLAAQQDEVEPLADADVDAEGARGR